jgi:hypothetical protein
MKSDTMKHLAIMKVGIGPLGMKRLIVLFIYYFNTIKI